MVQAIPEGVGSVVPYLCVRGARKAIEFYKTAFGAEVMSMMPMGDLVGHADLMIGSARVYLADEMPQFAALKSPATLKGTSANIHLWVEDCDVSFARAIKAGAKVAMPLADQFWGDRYGLVTDPFGHVWAISSHKEDLTPEEMMRRGEEMMSQMPPPGDGKKGGATAKKKAKAKATGPSAKSAPDASGTAMPVEPSSPGGGSGKSSKAEKKANKAKHEKAKHEKAKHEKSKHEKSRHEKSRKDKKSKKDKKRKKKSKR